MSAVGDMCMACFDREYRLCESCGKIIQRAVYDVNSGNYSNTFIFDGLKLCFNCSEARRYDRSNWEPTPAPWSKVSYDKIGSRRKFGVELETSSCDDWEQLRGRTYFGAKDDCSVSGKEFDSPVLYGDEGLDHLRDILAFAEEHYWEVNYDCGCHTHYDVRDLNYEQLCSVAYAYRKSVAVWKALVSPDRRDHEYSNNYNWTCSDFKRVKDRHTEFSALLCGLEMQSYEYVRFHAYTRHNTFENRMLEGCLDADTLCAWIKLNCRFIDAVKDMSIREIDAHFGRGQRQGHVGPFCALLDDSDLTDWVVRRGEENGRPFEMV
jgi:hypothetical protein